MRDEIWKKVENSQKTNPTFWVFFWFFLFFFFYFFSDSVPDLGDQFWYNRLCFWAGRWSKKMHYFSTFFPKSRKFDEKQVFCWTVNRLKKTSDCIKIDPPGPGRNFGKNQKSHKKWFKFLRTFRVFSIKTRVFWGYTPSGCTLRCTLRVHLQGAPLRGALGRAPLPFSRVEILKKFTVKSVPGNCTLFFGKNYVFGHFTY